MATPFAVPTQRLMPPRIATAYQFAKVIAPDSSNQLGPYAALWVGSAGDLTVVMRNGDGAGDVTPVTFHAVPAGTLLPVSVQGVTAFTGSAGSLVGLG